MRHLKIVLIVFGFTTLITGCLLTKGHFTNDGGMWVWNKDPEGKYNSHNQLQVVNATKWVDTVLQFPKIRTLQIENFSKKFDHYEVNDSIMFFNLDNKELANYHSYYTFAKSLDIEPELLKTIVTNFDKLGLNRFYKEEDFIAFETVTYLDFSKGYFYFPDSTITPKMNLSDTLHFKSNDKFKYFRRARSDRFLVTKKFDNHWIEWQQTNQ